MPRRGTVLLVATLSNFLVAFMGSSINIALPAMQAEFDLTAVLLGWMSLSYLLAAAAFLLPFGKIADLHGRKRVYLWGALLLAVGLIAGVFVRSTWTLLLFRVIQGFGSGMLFATGIAMVTAAYPPQQRGRALGINVFGVYFGLTLGPVLGGVLTQNLGWRSIFAVGAALAVVNLALSVWKLTGLEWKEARQGRFDSLGSGIYAVAFTALLVGFSWLPGWKGLVMVVGGLVGLVLFAWWESRAAEPVIEVDLFRRNRVFAFSNMAALINYSATFAMGFLMSLYLQYLKGLNPQEAGLVLVTGTAVQAIFSPLAGRLSDKIESRWVASAGMAMSALGLLAFVFLARQTSYWYIVGVLCVLGLGFALFSSPNTSTIMGSVEKRFLGVASASVGTMRLTGQSMSLGIATLVLVVVLGRGQILPADYPALLTSIRITFGIATALCVVGVLSSLVRGNLRADAGRGGPPGS